MTVLTGPCRPELINDDEATLESSFVVPDEALADVPAAPRGPATPVSRRRPRPTPRRGPDQILPLRAMQW